MSILFGIPGTIVDMSLAVIIFRIHPILSCNHPSLVLLYANNQRHSLSSNSLIASTVTGQKSFSKIKVCPSFTHSLYPLFFPGTQQKNKATNMDQNTAYQLFVATYHPDPNVHKQAELNIRNVSWMYTHICGDMARLLCVCRD